MVFGIGRSEAVSGEENREGSTAGRRISRKNFLRAGGIGVAGAALFGAAACGGQEEQGGQTGGSGEGLTSRSDILIEMPTHMVPTDSNTAIMQNSAERAAQDLGVEVNFRGPDTFDMPQIQQIFEASISAQPSAIAATLPDPDALGPLVQRAVEQDIPVVLFNAGLEHWEELGAITYVGQTELEAGIAAGERMAEAGINSAICFNQQQGQLVLDTRCRGFEEGLGGNVIEIGVSDASPTEERNAIKTGLRQNPDVGGLLTLQPASAENALRAVEEAGMQDQVTVATFDISPAVLEAVQNGNLLFAIDQQMFGQTYWSVVFLTNYIQWLINPVSAVPTGPDFVTEDNAEQIINLSAEGFH